MIRSAESVGSGDQSTGKLRLPQLHLDATGLMLTSPDSFVPPVDIIVTDKSYIIYLDVPGMSSSDITISRSNVITVVKGRRAMPYSTETRDSIEKQERKYGDFTLAFSIPHSFKRKWKKASISNGVLHMVFERDEDETEVRFDSLLGGSSFKSIEHGDAETTENASSDELIGNDNTMSSDTEEPRETLVRDDLSD